MYSVVRRNYRTPDGSFEWVVYEGPRHSNEPEYEIPYHSKRHRYDRVNSDNTEDLEFSPIWRTAYFIEWISYTNEQRTQIRRDTINFNEFLVEWKKQNKFVTFPQAQTCCDTVSTVKEDNMNNEFYTERNALDRDLRNSYRTRDKALRAQFHIDPDRPSTPREFAEYMDKKWYKPLSDEALDTTCEYDNPYYFFEFRKHPADADGYSKAKTKLDADYNAASVRVQSLPPAESIKDVEKFRPTVH